MLQVLRGSFGANKTYWVPRPQASKGVVVFFPGDQLEHALVAPEIRRLQDPKTQARLMAAKFQDCSSVVVMPSRLEGSYACFDHFLEQFTRSGEPLGYPASQLKATSQIATLLEAALPVGINHGLTCHLVGFSKGGVVLNQVLCEAAYCWEQSQAGQSTALPSVATHFLQRLGEIHFLDAGLNCRGAHLTDPQVISSLGQYVQQKSAGITIYLHGTPRQGDDARRPWVAQEKERFKALLLVNGIPFQEHRYFEGVQPTLLMHFEAIQAMQRLNPAHKSNA